jgi:hypothetical protein
VGRGKQDTPPVKGLQVVTAVIDQHISLQYVLVSQKYSIPPMDKWEVFIQPLVFFYEGIGKLHGRRSYIYLVLFNKLPHHLLAVGYRFQAPEEPGFKIVSPDAFPVLGDLFPDLTAHALHFGKGGPVTLVVTLYVRPVGIGHHLIHINENAHSTKYIKKGKTVKNSGVKTALFFREGTREIP